MKQNALTQNFIAAVNRLINTGLVPSYNDIAIRIGWNNTSMSNVINGRRNVPAAIYKKFMEMYKGSDEVAINILATDPKVTYEVAISRVILSALSEILAKQRKQPVSKVKAELEAAVRAQLK